MTDDTNGPLYRCMKVEPATTGYGICWYITLETHSGEQRVVRCPRLSGIPLPVIPGEYARVDEGGRLHREG